MANINALFAMLVGRTKDSRHIKASFSPISTDLLGLRVVQMPISPDLAIFVVTTVDKTDCFTPCACARDNNKYSNNFAYTEPQCTYAYA